MTRLTATLIAIFILSTTALSIVEAQLVTDGLVAYWTFDNVDIDGKTAKDVVGGNNGEIFGNPKTVEGKVKQGLEFEGQDDYIEATLPAQSLAEGTTLEFWFKQDAEPEWAIMMKVSDEIELSIENGTLELWSSVGRFDAKGSFGDDEWHHIAATVSDAEIILYVDSDNVGETAGKLVLANNPKATIGKDPGFTGWFLGLLDEVRIYNRPLSEEEIQQNMAAQGLGVVKPAGKLAQTWGKLKTRL